MRGRRTKRKTKSESVGGVGGDGEGERLRGDAVADKDDDWGKMQERMARAIISELRDDLDDLLRGLKAGTLDYITALKTLKILLQEDLNNPLVGAVEVKYRKTKIPIDEINVPPALQGKKKKGKPRAKK
jgi:hypothetical protein